MTGESPIASPDATCGSTLTPASESHSASTGNCCPRPSMAVEAAPHGDLAPAAGAAASHLPGGATPAPTATSTAATGPAPAAGAAPALPTIAELEADGIRLHYQPGCGGCGFLWASVDGGVPFTRDHGHPRQWWTLSRFLRADTHAHILSEVQEEARQRRGRAPAPAAPLA